MKFSQLLRLLTQSCSLVSGLIVISCTVAPKVSRPAVPVAARANTEISGDLSADRNADRLLIDDASDLKEKAKLSRTQVKDDLALLIYALKFGYGGRKYVEHRVFEGALARLDQLSKSVKDDLGSRTFLENADQILFAINDSHLVLRSPQTGLSSYRKTRLRAGSVGPNVSRDKSRAWDLSYRKIAGLDKTVSKSLPILSLTAMPAPEDEQWRGFRKAVEEALKSPVVAIDLRGNGGGSDVMGAWLAGRILGHDVVSPFDQIMRSQTPESLAIAANAWKLKIVWNRAGGKPVPEYFNARLAEKMAEYQNAKRALAAGKPGPDEQRFAMEYPADPSRPTAYKGRVILFLDAECASSCESLVEFFENAPNTISVGENTAGAVHFGNPGFVILPSSQLMLQLATDYWRYRDGRSLERIGHQPRVLLKAGENALLAADRLALPYL